MRTSLHIPSRLLEELKDISVKTEVSMAMLIRRGIREVIRVEKIKIEKIVDKKLDNNK